jgi:hydantoinase/carbamoylase family amidase
VTRDARRAVAAAVSPERLLGRLAELAAIGGDPSGGVTRIAFSPEERAATELVCAWLRAAGLDPVFDDFGNLFASTDANAPGGAPSLCGSHLDTVPAGGRFDGALGVVAAVEAVEAMRAAGALPERPLEVVVWRCEEPVRFAHGKVGSLLFSGQIARADLHPVQEPPLDLDAALASDGERPRREPSRTVASCLELHIEQGRRLEDAGAQLGVVTAVAAPIRLRASVAGRADHSGATPMAGRRDALCAAAELVLAVERAGRAESGADSVATTADVGVTPGAMNVVPGAATLLIDIRGIDAPSMERVRAAILVAAGEIAAARAVAISVDTLSHGTPTRFDPAVVEALADTAAHIGIAPLRMPSGAGHDTQCLAGMAACGMLFVPSVAGVSHAPDELTHDADVVAGTRALAAAWWLVASDRQSRGSSCSATTRSTAAGDHGCSRSAARSA